MPDVVEPGNPPTHRFRDFFKGEHYAFARGLGINPTHLPRALDAMLEDGWELMAVFGETSAEHIGFLFRRTPHDT